MLGRLVLQCHDEELRVRDAALGVMASLKYHLGLIVVSMVGFQSAQASENPAKIQEILVSDGGIYYERSDVPIETIFDNPAIFEGRQIRIVGLVDDQDSLKHWLYLDSGDARIYVATPMKVEHLAGKYVEVAGNVVLKHGVPSIVATGIKRRWSR